MVFIDIHTHRLKPNSKTHFAINSLMAGEDAPQIPGIFFSAGIHPWQLIEESEEKLENALKLEIVRPNVIAIGEAGLDRAIRVPLELQKKVFVKQAQLATEKGMPLIIHAVRSFPDLIQIRKSLPSESVWIVHGYQGNMQNAEQLLKYGIYLSFGAAILKTNGYAANVLCTIPLSSVFLETDNNTLSIEEVYEQAALLRKMPLDHFADEIQANFERIFPKGLPKML